MCKLRGGAGGSNGTNSAGVNVSGGPDVPIVAGVPRGARPACPSCPSRPAVAPRRWRGRPARGRRRRPALRLHVEGSGQPRWRLESRHPDPCWRASRKTAKPVKPLSGRRRRRQAAVFCFSPVPECVILAPSSKCAAQPHPGPRRLRFRTFKPANLRTCEPANL